MLSVSCRGAGQTLSDKGLFNAFTRLGIGVVQEPPIPFLSPGTGFYPNRPTGEVLQLLGSLTEATLPPLWSVSTEQPCPPAGAIESVTVNDPGDRYGCTPPAAEGCRTCLT
jgi:hypothetical protein